MPIGVVPYTLRFNIHTREHVKMAYQRLHEMGYDGLENGLGRERGLTVQEDLEWLAEYGLKVCSIYTDLSKPDEAMALAGQYGVKLLSMPAIPDQMMLTPDGFKTYAARMNEMAKPFAVAGFRLHYHNHCQEFRNFPKLDGKTGMDILIEETDPKAVAFELDVYWVSGAGGDPAQWVRKLKNRVPVIHFKDYAVDSQSHETGLGQIPIRFAEIGQGNINWPAVVEATREAGVEWYCVEQDRTVLDAFVSLKISVDYMRNTLGL